MLHRRGLAVLATTTVVLIIWPFDAPRPVLAACHVAAFEQSDVRVQERGTRATLTVVLQGGQPSCTGSVRYQTVDGTAKNPADYRTTEGVICFRSGDDRKEQITIPIVDDATVENDERFTVRLTDAEQANCAPDGISADATASVVITNDDAQTARPATPRPATASPPAPARTKAAPTASRPATPSPAATVTPTPTPTPTGSVAVPLAAPEEPDDGAPVAAAVGAAVALLGAAGALVFFRRRGV